MNPAISMVRLIEANRTGCIEDVRPCLSANFEGG